MSRARRLPGVLGAHRSHLRSGPPRAPTAAIRAVLADGRPHAWSEISARACPLVAPETAMARHRLANAGSRRGLVEAVMAGQQYCVGQALWQLERRAVVVRTGGRFLHTRSYALAGAPA